MITTNPHATSLQLFAMHILAWCELFCFFFFVILKFFGASLLSSLGLRVS